MRTDNIDTIISNEVATIGGKYIISKEIGTVRWSWNDDEGQLHTKKLNNVLYFPDSTVNIISATVLDESIKDDEGTFLPTKGKYYIFTWDFGKYKNIIARSEHYLTDLISKLYLASLVSFCKRVVSISIYSTFNFAFAYICTR